MKKLLVTIKQEMEVPDEWTLENTDDGIVVINMGGGRFLDMGAEPLVTEDKNGTWSDNYEDGFAQQILDMCQTQDTTYHLSEK